MGDLSWAEQRLAEVSPGEKIILATECKHGNDNKGWLVATDRCLWFFNKGLFNKGYEEFTYMMSTSAAKAGLMTWVFRIGSDQFQMSKELAQQWGSTVRRMRDSGSTA